MGFDRDEDANPDDEDENIVSENEEDEEAGNVVSEDEEDEDEAENFVSDNEEEANLDVQAAPADKAYNYAYDDSGSVNDEAQETREGQPPEPESPYAILARHGFVLKKALKSGITGDVALFTYTGNDERVKALMVNGMVLVKLQTPQTEVTFDPKEIRKRKHADATYKNEWDNINTELGNAPSGVELLRPGTLALDLNGAKIVLNECVYANAEKTSAKDLEQYMVELGQDRKGMLDAGTTMSAAEIASDAQIFVKIFASLVQAQSQLHRHGVLHLDTAPRNYMMTADGGLKVIDFGASLQMGEDGKAVNDPYFKINPACIYNQAALLPKKEPGSGKSILTDMFSRKIAMMEAMAVYMGVSTNPSELNRKLHYEGLTGEKNIAKLLAVDDVTRLKNSLNNLTNYAKELIANNDPRGQVVMNVVLQYRQYLTSVPAGQNANEIENNDIAAFRSPVKNTANILVGLSNGQPIDSKQKFIVTDPGAKKASADPGATESTKITPEVKPLAEIDPNIPTGRGIKGR